MRAFRAAAVTFAMLTMAGSVLAQNDASERDGPRGGRRGRGGFGRGMMDRNSFLGLLRMEEVRDELRVTEDQSTELRAAGEDVRENMQPPEVDFENFRNLSGEERRAAFEKMREFGRKVEQEARTKLASILDEGQMRRLRGLWVQRVGALAALSSDDIAAELELTDDQKAALADQRAEQREQFGGRGGRRRGEGGPPGTGAGEGSGDFRERFQQMRQQAEEKALGVLTDDQQQEFAAIKGEDFEFPQRGRGFRGGRGRGEGDNGDGPRRRRGSPPRNAE